MAVSAPLELVGGFGSPYSRKMRAVLRYRRIPFRWIARGSAQDVGIPAVPVSLIPVLVFPGDPDEAMIDSTAQIRRLELLYRERSAIPPDPALAFIDALIEDYADEWLTKAMFHYRWSYAPDIAKASYVLPLDRDLGLSGERLEAAAKLIGDRQIGRLGVVGSNETTRSVIEDSYKRLLALLSDLISLRGYVFGARPAACDFGIFGQLSQLALFDPTSAEVAETLAPRVIAWLSHTDDLGWLEVCDQDWSTREEVRANVGPLLREIGHVYAPFLLANAAALESGAELVECEIDGHKWVQTPFRYQGKCLQWLREGRAGLGAEPRDWVDEVLAGSGCETLF
ncbi:MAG: glutathione S-transferase N-terminal domain-containing protein [Myxococcota bacterium]